MKNCVKIMYLKKIQKDSFEINESFEVNACENES